MKKNIPYILIIFFFSVSFFICLPNLFIGDDCLFHTSNIIANASTPNILPSKILPLIEDNIGYGVNIFYPPLPHLIGSYIYRITNNIELVMQILEFSCIFLAGLTMYIYIKKVFHNTNQALLTSIFYISMPYFFTDVFTRSALNESFIFYLIPLIFLSFHYLIEKEIKQFYIYFVLSYSLAIYTHLVLTVYLTIFSLIYLIIFYKNILTKQNIKHLIIASITVLAITSPFWVLLLQHYLLKDYFIFNVKYILGQNFHTYKMYIYLFPNKLLSGAKNPLKIYINPISIIFIFLTYILLWQHKIPKKHQKILFSFLIITIISLTLESSKTIWKIVPNLLKNIQFPWRLSTLVAFTTSIIAGQGLNICKKKPQKILLTTTCIILLIINFNNCNTIKDKKQEPIYLNTNSNNNHSWQEEYLTIASSRDKYSIPTKLNLLEYNKNIKILKNNTPNLEFKVSKIEKEITIELPRIYYLGYELKNKNNQKIKLVKSINGYLEATIKKKGIYKLKYKGTILSRISNIISIFTLYIFLKKITKKTNY